MIEDVGSVRMRNVVLEEKRKLTIEFVYVLGIASRNHKTRPLRKPLASARTLIQ